MKFFVIDCCLITFTKSQNNVIYLNKLDSILFSEKSILKGQIKGIKCWVFFIFLLLHLLDMFYLLLLFFLLLLIYY